MGSVLVVFVKIVCRLDHRMSLRRSCLAIRSLSTVDTGYGFSRTNDGGRGGSSGCEGQGRTRSINKGVVAFP